VADVPGPGDGAERLGEVGRGQPHALALDPVEQPPPGAAGHLGLDVTARPPVGHADLGRVVGDVAPEQGRVVAGADQQALGARGVPGGVDQAELVVEDPVALQQLGHPEGPERGDAAVERRPVVLVAPGGEQLPVGPLDQVAGPREPRPGPVAVPGQVPADVVEVEVGEDDQVDLVRLDPGGGQLLGEPSRRPDPGGAGHPVAPDPGVDQHHPVPGPDHEAPVAQPPAVGAAERVRVAPPPGRPRRRLDPGEGLVEGDGEVAGDVAHGGDLDGPDRQRPLGHGSSFSGRGGRSARRRRPPGRSRPRRPGAPARRAGARRGRWPRPG
jgi:hypothetical protein